LISVFYLKSAGLYISISHYELLTLVLDLQYNASYGTYLGDNAAEN